MPDEPAGSRVPRSHPAGSPAKILFVIGTLDVGGSETQLVELVTRMDRRAFEPVVCSVQAGGPLQAPLRASGIRVHTLGFSGLRRDRPVLLPLDMFRALVAMLQLWRIMRRERPDIVHGILISAYLLATFVGRFAGVKIIVSGRRSLGLFKEHMRFYLMLERLADRLTDHFIANSEAVREDTLRREPVNPSDIVVIPNGLDLSRFLADDGTEGSRRMEDGPRVTVVANLIHYKGHEHFLRAWQEVLASYPRGVATLVGDGARRPHLQELTRTLGIEHAVRFVGVRRDVPDLLSNADLYVHPSLQEGSSNAVIEAMAAGKPIVATAVGGSVEAIRDGVTGLLVPPADAPALARAMLQLLADPVAARAMGRRAREAAARQFDVHAMVKAYECTYHRLLASPVGASEQPQTGGAEAS